MATWTVVKFISDDLIEVVPTNWLEGNMCFWPRYEPLKLTKAIKNCDPVLPSWERHEIISFRNATYGDYSQARKKCQKAELTSDLNSEEDMPRRRRLPNKLLESSSSSDSDCDNVPTNKLSAKKPVTLPECPSFNLAKNNTYSSELLRRDANGNGNQGEPSNIEVAVESNEKCSCIQFQKRNEEYFKQILRRIGMLEIMIGDVKTAMKTFSDRPPPCEEVDSLNIWQNFSLPINSEELLQEFEGFLGEDENARKSVDELAKVGGGNIDEFVKRCFKKLITNELQSKFSWLGKKQKKVFSVLQMAKLLKNAAWKNQTTKSVTEKQIEDSIQKYLKRAKERADAENKKKGL